MIHWSVPNRYYYSGTDRQPESNGNEEILHIPENSKTGVSPSEGLVSYSGHLLVRQGGVGEMKPEYSTVTADKIQQLYMISSKQDKNSPTLTLNIVFLSDVKILIEQTTRPAF